MSIELIPEEDVVSQNRIKFPIKTDTIHKSLSKNTNKKQIQTVSKDGIIDMSVIREIYRTENKDTYITENRYIEEQKISTHKKHINRRYDPQAIPELRYNKLFCKSSDDYKETAHTKTGIKYLLSKGYSRNDIVINGGGNGVSDLTTKSDLQDWEIKIPTLGNKILFTYKQILNMNPKTNVLVFKNTKDENQVPKIMIFRDIIFGKHDEDYIFDVDIRTRLKDAMQLISVLTKEDIFDRMSKRDEYCNRFLIFKNADDELTESTNDCKHLWEDCSNCKQSCFDKFYTTLKNNNISYEESKDWRRICADLRYLIKQTTNFPLMTYPPKTYQYPQEYQDS